MKDPKPKDPALAAARLLALKQAVPFQAFRVIMASGEPIPVTRPEFIEITDSGWCAEVSRSDGVPWYVLSLDWVDDIEIGGEVDPPPRWPRYAAKLRALQREGPNGPLVVITRDGSRFPLAGPHEFLLARDDKSLVVCDEDDGLTILEMSEISELEAGPSV